MAAARDSGLVRLVARCYDPADVTGVESVVVGTETPWLSTEIITRWRRKGIVVVGVFPAADRVAIALLCRSQVDQLFVETADPILVLRAVRALTPGYQRSNRFAASS